jgi:hypothetical protein
MPIAHYSVSKGHCGIVKTNGRFLRWWIVKIIYLIRMFGKQRPQAITFNVSLIAALLR